MTAFHAVLLLAAFLCSLAAGLLFAFAIVVMPGIKKLDDRCFIRAFQAIDGVIQNSQPVFLFVWMGSALAIVVAAVMAIWELREIACSSSLPRLSMFSAWNYRRSSLTYR
jgi:uncharacterized membrane protein